MKKYSPYLCIFVVVILQIYFNHTCLKENTFLFPPIFDAQFYLWVGLKFYHTLTSSGPLAFMREFLTLSPHRAPLFPATTIPIYSLFGTAREAAYLTNGIYLFVLYLSSYLITKRIFRKEAAMLAVFTLATLPHVIHASRDYKLELPMVSLMTTCVYFLIRSELFQERKSSICLGLSIGLLALTKTMSTPLILPTMAFCIYLLIRKRQNLRVGLTNILITVIISLTISAIWYLPNIKEITGYLVTFGTLGPSEYYKFGGPSILSAFNFVCYLFFLLGSLYIPLTAVIFFVLFSPLFSRPFKFVTARFFKRPGGRLNTPSPETYKEKNIVTIWFVCSYLILTLIPNKNSEYTLVLLPPLVIITSGLIVRRKMLKLFITPLVLLICSINYISLTFGIEFLPDSIGRHPIYVFSQSRYPKLEEIRGLSGISEMSYSRELIDFFEYVSKNILLADEYGVGRDWRVREVIELMNEINGGTVLLTMYHPIYNSLNLSYECELMKDEGKICDLQFIWRYPFAPKDIDRTLSGVNFILIKTLYQGYPFSNPDDNRYLINMTKEEKAYKRIFSLSLPDDSSLMVYIKQLTTD